MALSGAKCALAGPLVALMLATAVFGVSDIRKAQLIKAPAEAESLFGTSVRMTEDTLAVGSIAHAGYSGAVFIYKLAGDKWELDQTLTAPDGKNGDHFSWGMDIFNNRIVVGAIKKSTEGVQRGKAYVFHRSGPDAKFELFTELLGEDVQDGDLFGYQIELKGRNLFVTAEQGQTADGTPNSQGAVYCYKWGKQVGKWNLKQIIHGEKMGDQFGDETQYSQKTLAIGAPWATNDITGVTDTGAAYIYRLIQGKFTLEAKLTSPDSRSKDNFGTKLVISDTGRTVIVGADRGTGAASRDQGAAFVFNRSPDGKWNLDQTLTASDGHAKALFGSQMFWTPKFFVATAYKQSSKAGTSEVGAAYIFRAGEDGDYVESQALRPPKGHEKQTFGVSVTASEGWLAISLPRYDSDSSSSDLADTGLNDGAVQIYKVNNDPLTAINFLPRPTLITSGVVTVGFQYSSKNGPCIVRLTIAEGKKGLFKNELTFPGGEGIGEVPVTVDGLVEGEMYSVKIVLIRNGKVQKKRAEKVVAAGVVTI